MGTTKMVVYALLFIAAIVSGFLVSSSGRPLNSALFTVHKLVGVGTVALAAFMVYGMVRAGQVHMLALMVVAVTALFFAALFVSGALLSFDKFATAAIVRVHQMAPVAALLSSAISIYLLVGRAGGGQIGLTR